MDVEVEILSHIKKNEQDKIVFKKELFKHLQEVARASCFLSPLPDLDDYNLIKIIHQINAFGHDFGKYTPFFQEYLRYGKKKGNLYFHSFISAVWTAYLLTFVVKQVKEGWGRYAPLIGYFVVIHHHNDLGSLENDVPNEEDLDSELAFLLGHISNYHEKLEILEKQIDSLLDYREEIEADYSSLLNQNVDLADFKKKYLDTLKNLDKLCKDFISEDENLRTKVYYYLQLLFSLLIDGDKHSAANITFSKRHSLPKDLVERYALDNFTRKPVTELDHLRVDFAQTAREQLKQFDIQNRVYTITSPTGSGKTLTSFGVALGMRNIICNEYGYEPRIIYALPFTSIIEQNYKVLYDVLSYIPSFSESESPFLLKHHHLAEVSYRENKAEKPISEALLLTESWESEVVITTFYQLLHSIIGYKNRYLKKIHQLVGSIIILDEIQNVPAEYWSLLNNVLINLSRYLGCYIILLTATKPFIFEDGKSQEWIPIDKVKSYFKSLNRMKIVPILPEGRGGWTEDEWMEKFKEIYNPKKSHLLILNTVQSSINIFYKLKDYIRDCPVCYLSTNITPLERMERLDLIEEYLKEQIPIVVVSTQVIEAGVDLDFDVIVRDLAPIDSIVQAAGRGNRHGKREQGTLWILPLERIESRSDCVLVYGAIHRNLALEGLNKTVIHEKEFYEWIEDYFNRKTKKIDMSLSENIWDGVQNLRFYVKDVIEKEKTVSRFKLIENQVDMVSLFIQMDERAVELWEFYMENVILETDFEKRKKAYLSVRSSFQSYIISVPILRVKNLEEYGGIYLLRLENLSQYYKADDTGFIRKPEDASAWML